MKPIKIIEKLNEGETVFKVCPFCGKESTLELTDDESSRYNQYKNDTSITIQDALPNLNPSERECLISGLCSSCQKEMFDSTYESDRITEGVETKAGNDMDEICAYAWNNYTKDDGEIPTREQFEYIADVTAKEYKQIKYLLQKAYNNVADHHYAYDYNDDYIELNDNHTIWELNDNGKDDEEWWSIVNSKVAAFKGETGVELYLVGRSGRHACVDNTFYNALHYDELKEVQERLEQEAIDEFNDEELTEATKVQDSNYKILSTCKDYNMLKDALDVETLKDIDKVLQHYENYLSKEYDNDDKAGERDLIDEYFRKYGNGYIIDWYEGLMPTEELISELNDNNYEINELEESSDWDYNTAESWRCDYPEPHYKDEDEDEEDEDEYVNDYPQEEYDRERAVFGDEE